MHPERLKLWTEFNNCWLVALQRQKEITLDARAKGLPGGRPAPPLTLMEPDLMESMGKEIVRLCDIMEKFGLVDYEMGVWEEDIINRTSVGRIVRWSDALQCSPNAWTCWRRRSRPAAPSSSLRRRAGDDCEANLYSTGRGTPLELAFRGPGRFSRAA
jgi:hypothetical protein